MKYLGSPLLLVLALLVGFWGGMKYQSGGQEAPVTRPNQSIGPEDGSSGAPTPAARPIPKVIEIPVPAQPPLPGPPPPASLPRTEPDPIAVQLQNEETAASLRRDGIPEEDIQQMLAGSRKEEQAGQEYLPQSPELSPEEVKEEVRASLEAEGLPSQDIDILLKGGGKENRQQ